LGGGSIMFPQDRIIRDIYEPIIIKQLEHTSNFLPKEKFKLTKWQKFKNHMWWYCKALARPANYDTKAPSMDLINEYAGIRFHTSQHVPENTMFLIHPSTAQVIKDINNE
jgi:hypothetical protein